SNRSYAVGILGGFLGGPDNGLSGSRSDGRWWQVRPDEPLAAAPPGQQVVRATQKSSGPVSQLGNSYPNSRFQIRMGTAQSMKRNSLVLNNRRQALARPWAWA